jgi:hypothetical protein
VPLDRDERDKIRDRYADDGRRGQVEQAASAYLTARELGQVTAMDDARNRMAALGYESDAAAKDRKAQAAEDRKQAAADTPDKGEPKGKGPAPAQTGTRGRATRGG